MALKIKRAERLVDVALDGALVAEWEATDEAYKVARAEQRASRDKRMNDPLNKRVQELREKAQELSAKAREDRVTFRLRALPRDVWDDLVTQNPRRSQEQDGGLPFNTDTITDAAMSTPGTIIDVTRPDGTEVEFTHEDWAEFAEDLSRAQYEDFMQAVISLNAGANEVPFLPASAPTTDSDKN